MSKDTMEIVREQDVVPFRNRVREFCTRIGMSLVNQTKLITAASELVRNMLKYANGGEVLLEIVSQNAKTGVRLTFTDQGPGISDIALAMRDGFSTGRSLGLGLPGTKRLVNEFDLKSQPGQGTTVTVIHWKHGR
ncbi:anti-sigma regulatory factor [Pontibacter sp. JH31]|uniref:Anti-sigma regulatory factor n=1 Tax=Pontibacter aquaedesilientis TaxID=2766980 RepID=A0ABR7XK48_9BACT|nr:anti-sigma regulatory factor [Pontibacter aquaedesilientis]MBD1398661.1 anti-sigma regulatory factor [Pontibacter aquaedesilientis]